MSNFVQKVLYFLLDKFSSSAYTMRMNQKVLYLLQTGQHRKEVNGMTDMKRVSFAIPDELDRRILELKKNGSGRESYSEVVRRVLDKGLEAIQGVTSPDTPSASQGAAT